MLRAVLEYHISFSRGPCPAVSFVRCLDRTKTWLSILPRIIERPGRMWQVFGVNPVKHPFSISNNLNAYLSYTTWNCHGCEIRAKGDQFHSISCSPFLSLWKIMNELLHPSLLLSGSLSSETPWSFPIHINTVSLCPCREIDVKDSKKIYLDCDMGASRYIVMQTGGDNAVGQPIIQPFHTN